MLGTAVCVRLLFRNPPGTCRISFSLHGCIADLHVRTHRRGCQIALARYLYCLSCVFPCFILNSLLHAGRHHLPIRFHRPRRSTVLIPGLVPNLPHFPRYLVDYTFTIVEGGVLAQYTQGVVSAGTYAGTYPDLHNEFCFAFGTVNSVVSSSSLTSTLKISDTSAVPEPSTYLIGATGLLALLVRRGFKK